MNNNILAKLAIAGAGAAVVLFSTSPKVSAFEIFTNRADWETAVAGKDIWTETFDSFIPNVAKITFDTGIISEGFKGTIINQTLSGIYSGAIDTDGDAPFDGFEEIVWTFPREIWAFGGDFVSAATGEVLQIMGDFDGKGEEVIDSLNVLGLPGDGFLGIVGEAEFTSIKFRTRTDDSTVSTGESFSIDNFSFAEEIKNVPEQGTSVGTGENFGIDNFSLAKEVKDVPEQETLVGLALLGIGGLINAKKKKNR